MKVSRLPQPVASTITFTEALRTLVPAATGPDALVQQLSELWNTGKTQKKLGECTPQGFLQTYAAALRSR